MDNSIEDLDKLLEYLDKSESILREVKHRLYSNKYSEKEASYAKILIEKFERIKSTSNFLGGSNY